MSATEILKKIHSDAEAEVVQIQTQAANDVQALEMEAAAKQAELQITYETTRDRLVTRDREEIISKAQHASQIELQCEKRTAVDAVLTDLFAQLTVEADDVYRARYQSVLHSLPLKTVTVKSVETAPQRIAITEELLAASNIVAPVVPNESISGGMRIITTEQQFDCTLDRFFAAARPQLEIEAARILFGR